LTSADGKHWQTAGSTYLISLKIEPGRLSVLADGHGGYRAFFAYATREQRKAGVLGVLLSSDGNQWRRADAEIKLAFQDVEAGDELALAPAVVPTAEGLWVWLTLQPGNGAEKIKLAFLKE
jgi:hypothetical protein